MPTLCLSKSSSSFAPYLTYCPSTGWPKPTPSQLDGSLPSLKEPITSPTLWSGTLNVAWRATTTERYGSSINDFLTFCTRNGVSHLDALPASEDLLCLYANSHAGLVVGGTIANKLSAICGWHIANNVPYHGGLQLKYVIRGVENSCPDKSKRKPRPPLDLAMLSTIRQAIDISTELDACIWSLVQGEAGLYLASLEAQQCQEAARKDCGIGPAENPDHGNSEWESDKSGPSD
ncbi:hypothetical protein C0991_001929 [Blastosporella zonata]|nr:hypothetical protein C0991_001929 [Blastosporella zonata]